jgi:hypothetical protein
MPGERTLMRLFLDGDETMQAQWFLEGHNNETVLKLLGMLHHCMTSVSNMLQNEDMDQDDVDDIRKLFDE